MTTAITVAAAVDRPAQDVYDYATDPRRFAEWQRGVVDGRIEDGVDPDKPKRCIMVRRIGFTTRASTSDVVDADRPRTWAVQGIDGPIRARVDVTVTPLDDDRSEVTIAVDFAGHGIGRLLVPLLVRRQARREMPANMAALKRRLEGRA